MKVGSLGLDILKLMGHWDIRRAADNCLKGQKVRREIWTGATHLRATGVGEIKQGEYAVRTGKAKGRLGNYSELS